MSETVTASERIYRTVDGDLVAGTDPGAAFLAYAEGDELTSADAAAWKNRGAPADKQRRPAANKAAAKKPAGDGGGGAPAPATGEHTPGPPASGSGLKLPGSDGGQGNAQP